MIESLTELHPGEPENVKPRFLMLTPPEIAGFDLKALAWGMDNFQEIHKNVRDKKTMEADSIGQ